MSSVVTPSGVPTMAILAETGLVFFLNHFDKTAALPLQISIAGEFLPAIRKYAADLAPQAEGLHPSVFVHHAAQAAGLKAAEEWKQDLAHKIGQARGTSKGSYENSKRVLEILARIAPKPSLALGDVQPKEATQLLNAVHRCTTSTQAWAAAQRLFPGHFSRISQGNHPLVWSRP